MCHCSDTICHKRPNLWSHIVYRYCSTSGAYQGSKQETQLLQTGRAQCHVKHTIAIPSANVYYCYEMFDLEIFKVAKFGTLIGHNLPCVTPPLGAIPPGASQK